MKVNSIQRNIRTNHRNKSNVDYTHENKTIVVDLIASDDTELLNNPLRISANPIITDNEKNSTFLNIIQNYMSDEDEELKKKNALYMAVDKTLFVPQSNKSVLARLGKYKQWSFTDSTKTELVQKDMYTDTEDHPQPLTEFYTGFPLYHKGADNKSISFEVIESNDFRIYKDYVKSIFLNLDPKEKTYVVECNHVVEESPLVYHVSFYTGLDTKPTESIDSIRENKRNLHRSEYELASVEEQIVRIKNALKLIREFDVDVDCISTNENTVSIGTNYSNVVFQRIYDVDHTENDKVDDNVI